MPLVKVYALESDIWEHFSCLSKHSDIYRTMLFLIKVAQKGEEAWEAQHVLLATTRVHLKQTLQNQHSSEDSRGAGYLCNYTGHVRGVFTQTSKITVPLASNNPFSRDNSTNVQNRKKSLKLERLSRLDRELLAFCRLCPVAGFQQLPPPSNLTCLCKRKEGHN